MPLEIILALIASVLMHVAWNLIARHQPAQSEPLWWVLLAHLVLLGPWGVYHLATQVDWSMQFVVLLCISAISVTVYFFALTRAYAHAPVALVYPLVRSSPLLVALWCWLLFSENLGLMAWLGIALNVAGLLIMAMTGRDNHEGRAMPWAGLAMLATSCYSLSDKAATAYITSFNGLIGYISVGYFLAWCMLSLQLRIRNGRWKPQHSVAPWVMLSGGLCIGTAYALVVYAMRILPAAEVLTYSNAGIVIATLSSILIFKERTHWLKRCAGVILICGGLLILALDRARIS